MTARPGKLQVAFNGGEIGPRFDQRTATKAYAGGLKTSTRLELLPQGGFTLAAGLRYIGDTDMTAARLIPFAANNGNVYDLAVTGSMMEVWGASSKLHQFAHVYSAAQAAQLDYTQQADTLLTFHEDKAPWRALHGGPTSWVTANAPLTDIPNYDYGGAYSNGAASQFELDFIGFDNGNAPYWDNIVFTITVSGQETTGIRGTSTSPPSGGTPVMATLAANIQTAILALPNVKPGVTCTVVSSVSPYRVNITFGGALNAGDIWTLSGRLVNKADAAVLVNKIVVGVAPGEALISAAKGWPRCGTFYQQRLLMGGFKSLPNAWIASRSGGYYDFNGKLTTSDGSFLIVLDVPGGERVERLVNNQFLLVMTSENNFWVAGSTQGLSKTSPPKHVPATDHGIASFVPVVGNERAAIYVHKTGDFVGELRYTDIDGNYVATDISLMGYHLVKDVVDIAVKSKAGNQSANMAAVVNADGTLRAIYLLREQDLTGFSRLDTQGQVKACAVNNRNDLTLIVERNRGAARVRSIERQENGLLLDAAIDFSYATPRTVITGLGHLEGQTVWALGDGHVQGPYIVSGATVTLDIAVLAVTVGLWTAPVAQTLPLARMIGPDLWLQKRARIHTVQLFVEDTTSLAVACNGGKLFDVNLRRFGQTADVPELYAPANGLIKLGGFGGYVDEPTVTISQLRPGRLTVKSIISEAAL